MTQRKPRHPPAGVTRSPGPPAGAILLWATVWIYADTSRQVGDAEHLKVFADQAAAESWFLENDPEGVAFEYPVIRAAPP